MNRETARIFANATEILQKLEANPLMRFHRDFQDYLNLVRPIAELEAHAQRAESQLVQSQQSQLNERQAFEAERAKADQELAATQRAGAETLARLEQDVQAKRAELAELMTKIADAERGHTEVTERLAKRLTAEKVLAAP